MSLADIRQARLAGFKPAGVTLVVIGPKPALDDGIDLVIVEPDARPESIDFRPLVGVWVAVMAVQSTPDRTLRVLAALHEAGVKFFGYADAKRTEPMTLNPGPEHHAVLRRSWEVACTS